MRKILSLTLLLASSLAFAACTSSDTGEDVDDASTIVDPDADAVSDGAQEDVSADGDGSGDEAGDVDATSGDGDASTEGDTSAGGDADLPSGSDAGTELGADGGGTGGGQPMDANGIDATSVGTDADTDANVSDTDAGSDGGQSDAGPSTYLCGQGPQSADVLLDLGGTLSLVGRTATRVLTGDGVRWVLWDATTRVQVRSGVTDARTSMGGDYFTTHVGADVEVRALSDGQVVSRATGIGWAELSVDGSYLWTLNGSQQLRAWSRDGTPLVDKSGYAGSNVIYPAPGELRVARNVNTDNVIATVVTATGVTSISSPYSGAFRAWFQDGEHFLTSATGIVRVYSKIATAPQIFAVTPPLPSFEVGGTGDHFWITASSYVAIYRLGSAAPVFETTQSVKPQAAGSRVWLTRSEGQGTVLEVFDFSGATVGRTTTPVTWSLSTSSAALGDESGGWAVWDGRCNSVSVADIDEPSVAPRLLGCGSLLGIAGSEAGRIAVLTCDRIFWFSVNGGAKQLEGSLAIVAATQPIAKIELSKDGSVLAASDGRSIKLYRLPSGTLLHDISYPLTPWGWPFDLSFVLSDSGNVLGQYKCDSATTCERFAASPNGASTLFTAAGYNTSLGGDTYTRFWSFAISPSDARFAISNGGRNTSTASQIYEGNSLIGAADGYLVDWLSNEQLLVNRYRIDRFGPGGYTYTMAQVVDRTGAVLRNLTQLPQLSSITRLADGRIYGRQTNRIYSTTDGSVLWSSPNRTSAVPIDSTAGDVAGDRVVFLSGTPYTSGGAPAVTSHLLRSEAY